MRGAPGQGAQFKDDLRGKVGLFAGVRWPLGSPPRQPRATAAVRPLPPDPDPREDMLRKKACGKTKRSRRYIICKIAHRPG